MPDQLPALDAPCNPTANMREVITIIYFPNGTLVREPANPSQQLDLDVWLPGCKVGELAAAKLNPVIYSR